MIDYTEIDEAIRENLPGPLPLQSIAREFHVAKSTVWARAKELAGQKRPNRTRINPVTFPESDRYMAWVQEWIKTDTGQRYLAVYALQKEKSLWQTKRPQSG